MKECMYCGTEMKEKATICPNCKKKQKSPVGKFAKVCILVIFVAAVLIAIISASSDDNSSATDSEEEKCYATLEEFNQIENGMTYDEAKEIIGCEGTVNSDTEVSGYTMTIYSWYGKDGISNMNITVSNGKISNKTQIGLD